MNQISTVIELETKNNFLLLGFERHFLSSLEDIKPFEEYNYDLEHSQNPVSAYNLLLHKVKKGEQLPKAIICSYDFWANNPFLMEHTRKHPQLRLIPFILFADKGTSINKVELIKSGVDDCYFEPVSWKTLQKRIDFLSRFKEDLTDYSASNAQKLYRIPLGKRLFDIAFASTMILILSPVLLTIALMVKFSSKGPIIYRSKRVGTGYQVFHFLKFRSMCQDADAKLKDLAHLNQYNKEGKEDSGFIKLENDPRITKIGKIIRKTSLDELPQLFNVLRGEMSIVGNRPLPLYEAEKMTRDQWAGRFLAPAGITGLWQVCEKGKDNLTVEERVGLDVEYAHNYSFLMDNKIFSRTIPAMLQKES